MSKIYLIGSLRNDQIPIIAKAIEAKGHTVFADWFSPGPRADEYWQMYEQARGRDFFQAIHGPHARHVFEWDKQWLDWCDAAVLALPAGKSAHMELLYVIGQGKRGYVLFDGEPERWDVMYQFADDLFKDINELLEVLW